MKLSQILSVLCCSFLLFQNIHGAVGEVAEDFSKNFTILDKGNDLFDVIDNEGNVLKDVTQKMVDFIKRGEVRTLKELQTGFNIPDENFLKADTQQAKKFFQENNLTQKAVDRLRGKSINIGEDQNFGLHVKASKDYAAVALKDANRAQFYADQVTEFSSSVSNKVTQGLDNLSTDLQAVRSGTKSIQAVVEKYKNILNGVSDQNLGRLDVMNSGKGLETKPEDLESYSKRGATVREGRTEALNKLIQKFGEKGAAKDAILQSLAQQCTDIVADDAMSEIAQLQSSMQRDVSKLGGYDERLNNVIQEQVRDVKKFTTIGTDANGLTLKDFLDSNKKTITDAQGNEVAGSAIEKKLQNLSDTMDQSSGKVLQDLKQDLATNIKNLSDRAGVLGRFSSRIYLRDGALEDLGKTLSRKAQSVTSHDVADAFATAGEKLKSVGAWSAEKLKEVGMVMVSSVLFMLPTIFQSAFLALKQRMVQLETLAAPVQFGNWVLQIPASCIDLDNPATGTIPLYLAVPVQQLGDSLTTTAITTFKGSVGDLTSDNPVSNAIHTKSAALFSLGSSSKYKIPRYVMHESAYLGYNPDILATFFTQGSYQQWASLPVTSDQFTSGAMIALNTGLVAGFSGEQQNATGIIPALFKSYPLKYIAKEFDWHNLEPQQNLLPLDVESFLLQLGSKLELSDNNVKFTEYVNVGSGSHGPQVNNTLIEACNCKCLDEDAVVCSQSQCMLKKTLDQYQAGLSIASNGTLGFDDNTLTAQVASLGSVAPMFGWGTDAWYPENINQTNFPGFSFDLSQIMSTRAQVSGQSSAPGQAESVKFADESTNFASQGCWVYLSASTPFAKAVQANSSQLSLTGPYVDYIIFLDGQNNMVPLHVPVQQEHTTAGYTRTQIGFNPSVKYWTSIAAFYNDQILPMFADEKTGFPVKYDLKGNAWADSNLAGQYNPSSSAPGTAVLSAAIANLDQNFNRKLYNQFIVHQQAMVDKLNNGPFAFGSATLIASPYSIQVPGATSNSSISIALYRGAKCYASSVEDLLVPFSSDNQPVTLPATDVAYLYSLVTDIAYAVNADGSLTPNFSQAPLTQNTNGSYSVNTANIDTYYFLNGYIEQELEQVQPLAKGASAYVDLCDGAACSGGELSVAQYAAQQRNAWVSNFDPSIQKQGIQFGSLLCTMPQSFSGKKAAAAGAFIYEIVPSPSAALCDHDLFVISNNPNPVLATLQPINAELATQNSVLVSLMTGFVYDAAGTQIMNPDGSALRLSAPVPKMTSSGNFNKVSLMSSEIYDAIVTRFKLSTVANESFVDQYQAWVKQYEAQMHRVMGPYSFGSLSLVILAGDWANGNYVYLSSVGMHKSNFEPSDIFVTYDPTSGEQATTFGTELNANTPYMISLVSGNQYDPEGNIVGTLEEHGLLSLTQVLSDKWGNWLTALVNVRQAANKEQRAVEDAEQNRLDALYQAIAQEHDIVMTSDVANQIINQLQPTGTKGLAVPYGLLKHDPISGHFVHVSPLATATSTGYIYLFFNIGTDKKTGEHIGGIYHVDGQGAHCVHVVKGIHLKALQDQFGVVVDGDNQTLAIPTTQPLLYMSSDSASLTVGSNSKDQDLIVSTSDEFPGGPVKLSAKNMFLYYSQSMQAYFVWDVKKSEWISVVPDHDGNGYVYDKSGNIIPDKQTVAVSTSTSKPGYGGVAAADDLMLIYDNTQGNPQAYMSDGYNYSNIDQTSGTMNWIALDATNETSLIVTQGKSKYTVQKSNKKTIYQVDQDYSWYQLIAVPEVIDDSDNFALKAVDLAYAQAELVMKNNVVSHLLFNHVMYKVSTTSGNAYTMIPVKSIQGNLQVVLGNDAHTHAPYVKVTDGQNTYTYMYVNKLLTAQQFESYQALFGGVTATSTRSFEVGSPDAASAKSVKIGDTTISIAAPKATTNVIFAKNIPTSHGSTLALTPITSSSVLEIPDKGEAANQFKVTEAAFLQNLDLVLKSADGRFFVRIPDVTTSASNSVIPSFSYVSRAYVELGSGVLYSADTGVSLGYCLNLDDWLSVLNAVQVSALLVTLESGKYVWQLYYRTPKVVETEAVQVGQAAITNKVQG